jgi:hypothetical protein
MPSNLIGASSCIEVVASRANFRVRLVPFQMGVSSSLDSGRADDRPRYWHLGRVEDGRGGLGPTANTPFPISAHRTRGPVFRSPAHRLAPPQAHGRVHHDRRSRHNTPHSPCSTSNENWWLPRPATLCRLTRNTTHALADVEVDSDRSSWARNALSYPLRRHCFRNRFM